MSAMDEDFVVELSADDAEAMTSAIESSMREPLPVKREAKPRAERTEKPAKVDESASLRERLRAAEAKAAEERSKRLALENTVVTNNARLAHADVHIVDNQAALVDGALAKAKADAEQAKAAHKAALESGDYEAATAAMQAMTDTSIALRDLNEGKQALAERQRETRDKAKSAAEAKPTEVADPFEKYVSQFGPREQEWLRAHPEAVNTPRLNKEVLWAHDEAVEQKIKPGTDEYFAFLDKTMGYDAKTEAETDDENDDPTHEESNVGEDEVVVDTAKPKPVAAQPAKKVAAPVSRDTNVVTRQEDGKYQVRLTAEQKQFAIDLGMSPTAYAKQLVRIKSNEKTGAGPVFTANMQR